MLELIVTGTGRCGTGFAAKWLSSVGIRCGHEAVFTPHGMGQARYMLVQGPPLMADAAWEAAPFLRWRLLEDVPCIHLVRHPKRVAASLARVPPSTTPIFDEFCKAHFPRLYGCESVLDAAVCRVVEITRRIEILRPERYVWRIEDGTEGVMDYLEHIGLYNPAYDPGEPFSDTRYNHKAGQPVEVRLEEMQPELAGELVEAVEQYGYKWNE